MHNNKLITILKHFDKSDFRQFGKYIISPYFNKSQQLIHFFQLIEKGINSPKKTALKKENIWKKLFPKQGYNDVRFRKLCSDLLKQIEYFFAQQIYDKDELQKSSNQIKAIGNRSIKKFYSSVKRQSENIINNYPFEDAEFYLQQYHIESNFFEINQHEFKNAVRHNFDEIDYNLTVFFIIEKLRCYCNVLSQKTPNISYNVKFDNKVLQLIEEYKDKVPAISIYHQIYLTYIEEDNQEHYFKLKQLLKEFGQKFHSVEARTLYDSSINYCVGKMNKGFSQFTLELFELYQDYLKKEAIYVDGELHPFHFKNIVVCALRSGEYDWTENFIISNKDRLPESSRENAVNFNLARLYYYKKNYEKVIALLQEVEYEDIVYSLSSKSLLIATFYENDEIEPLYSLLESFRAYLNRRKDIPDRWRKNYMNLIKFTRKLTRIIPGDKNAIRKIKEEINSTEDITSLEWLNERIAELEK